ncbi:PepSY domain-containing protein [Geothrix sp. PMB-07]|uniref:PepSY-associated TM helix domain-containing protein n=1 Tax=Geothrix sp. PMB-07 TaxID=3068640 RepID=UPI0027425A86|nr:PepSY-associated TM helix domain-containing protein [Geothrix sp. PMB-07]WLT31094.1 PepSY-associated TM helix domain-containing protein [Geothrix sp. PMB-07]
MLRRGFVKLHRWFGLGAAAFLFIAGFTGAIISWDHELDAWLNPSFYQARGQGPARPALVLAAAVEAAEPRARIRFMPLEAEPGQTLLISLEPRLDPATGRPHDLGYNQIAVDPATGDIQARREWGQTSLSRENLLPFLYKLHYSLHLPKAWGLELGVLLMGVLAILWVFDCFIALWISFPSLATWRQSFSFRWRQGGPRLVFDLHRSGGVWAWFLLLILAVTSVSMNLNTQVMRPLVSRFSRLTPSPFERRAGQVIPAEDMAGDPRVSMARAVDLAQAEAHRRGWTAPPGGVFFSAETALWGVGFFKAGQSHGDGGLGNPWLYFDAHSGESLGADVPGTGSAGDIFLQAMFPLHSGRILGLPGRILVSLLGLAVATLSATGILIWLRRRRSEGRVRSLRRP